MMEQPSAFLTEPEGYADAMFGDAVRVVVLRGRAAVYDSWDAAEPEVQIRDRIEVTRPDGSIECYEAFANLMDAIVGSPGWHPIPHDCH